MLATKYLDKLKRLSSIKIREKLEDNWEQVKAILVENGNENEFVKTVNTMFKLNISSMSQLDMMSKLIFKEERKGSIKESKISDFWSSVKSKFLLGFEVKDVYVKKFMKLLTATAVLSKSAQVAGKIASKAVSAGKTAEKIRNTSKIVSLGVTSVGVMEMSIYLIMWLLLIVERYKEHKQNNMVSVHFEDGSSLDVPYKKKNPKPSFFDKTLSKLTWLKKKPITEKINFYIGE